MAIVASQLIGKIEIQGSDQAKSILLGMSNNSKKAQDSLDKLQSAAKDAASILSNRFVSELKSAQGGLESLSSKSQSAGLDVSKLASLQQKASEAAARLGVAQAQAATAQEKANAITNDGSASAEKIALAQAKAALAAENVRKAEMSASDAMTMLRGEATRLADALEASQAKGNLFSNAMSGLKERASGFFGAIAEAPAKLSEATQRIGLFIFGVQQIIQTGQQAADVFIDLGKKAGDFQSGITQLSTGAGELSSNLGMVSDSLLKMAPDVGTTTKELESGLYLIESAGQHGADGLKVLENAAKGAKVGNADLADVANGVTTALTDYAMSADQSAAVTNDLIATVASGKTTMGQLASSLKDILPIASTAGISLNGVSAAMATMTGEGVPASQAAAYLRGMVLSLIAPSVEGKKALAGIGLSAQDVASEMRDSLPGALKMVTDHLKQKFPEGSAAYMEALKQITGGSESLSAVLDLTGDHMKVFDANVENIYQAVRKGGTGIAGWSEVQKDFNFQMDKAKEGMETLQIKMGTKLFPVFTQVFGWVSDTAIPVLSNFSDWFFDKGIPALQNFVAPLQTAGKWFQDFVGHSQATIPILAGIASVITALLIPAMISFFTITIPAMGTLAVEVVAATWPFVALGAAVAGVTAIFMHFYNTNTEFRNFINGIGNSLKTLWTNFSSTTSNILGSINQLVNGVDEKTKKASIASQLNTAEMKDKSIANAQKMNEEIQMKFINMRNDIEGELSKTTDAVQRHTLEMKLKSVNNSLEMAQASGRNIVDMRNKSQEQMDLLKQGIDTSLMTAADRAKYHSLNMKKNYLDGVIKMDEDTVKQLDKMRADIAEQLSHTTDTAKKEALNTKLAYLNHQEETVKESHNKNVQMRQNTENEMENLKKSIADKSAGMFKHIQNTFGGMGQWFQDRWKDVQNAFGNTGQWFHDKWNEAWSGVTGFFGGIGKWFGDRWKDTQNVFGSIGKWFHDRWQEAWNSVTDLFGKIGQWFQERFNDIASATAPFRHYMGAVFETIWNILVALWGKLGQWFHDRWQEAYNRLVEVFGPVGKWFQDRWMDIQNIFGAVGKWFGDRWKEAYNATTTAFASVGKWFQDRWIDVQNVFASVGKWFSDRWSEAWNAIVSFFGPIGKWFQDRWTDVQNIFKAVGKWFSDRFQEAWNGIVSFFGPIGKWFQDRWNEVTGGINTFAKFVSDKFNDIKVGATNIFRGMINSIVDQLNNGIGAIESFINLFGQGLNSVATALGTKGTVPVAHLGRIPHYAEGTQGHPGGPAIVGEKGPELVFLPKGAAVVPNDLTKLLLPLQGKIPGYAGGVGDIAGSIMDWIAGGAQRVLDGIISSLHISAPNLPGMGNIAGAMFDKVKSWALGWIDKILPKFDFGTDVPGTVQNWITTAMSLTHVPANWAGPLGTIAMKESGGNPKAINDWDSNAAAGHPSKGLFQTIDSTFRAYALAGHLDIFNPIDNAAAAIGYIKSRYGDVFHVPGIMALAAGKPYVGYADGGIINEPIAGLGLKTGTRYAFGERGKELVTPYIPSGVNLSSFSNSSRMPEIHIHNYHHHYLDGKQLTNNVMTTATKTSRGSGPIRS